MSTGGWRRNTGCHSVISALLNPTVFQRKSHMFHAVGIEQRRKRLRMPQTNSVRFSARGTAGRERAHRPERERGAADDPSAVHVDPESEQCGNQNEPGSPAFDDVNSTRSQEKAASENTCGRMWLICPNVPSTTTARRRSRLAPVTAWRPSATNTAPRTPTSSSTLSATSPGGPGGRVGDGITHSESHSWLIHGRSDRSE